MTADDRPSLETDLPQLHFQLVLQPYATFVASLASTVAGDLHPSRPVLRQSFARDALLRASLDCLPLMPIHPPRSNLLLYGRF